jgi:hypothetical protein
MKRLFYPYTEWEDYQNGLYDSRSINQKIVNKNFELLSNQDTFYQTALKVVEIWVKCSNHNLSNRFINRRAWLGQASCCYKNKSNDLEVREAWKNIDFKTKNYANATASKIIKIYESKNKNLYQELGKNGILQWYSR